MKDDINSSQMFNICPIGTIIKFESTLTKGLWYSYEKLKSLNKRLIHQFNYSSCTYNKKKKCVYYTFKIML